MGAQIERTLAKVGNVTLVVQFIQNIVMNVMQNVLMG